MAGGQEVCSFPLATDDGDHLAAIRRFFLQPLELYFFEELAVLWRAPIGEGSHGRPRWSV